MQSHAAPGADHHEVALDRHRIDPLGQQQLKHHIRTVAEANLHGRQIVFPHAAEPFAGNSGCLRAVRRKPVAPMLERIIVVAGKRQPLAAYRFGGLECMLLGPGEGGLMSMIG